MGFVLQALALARKKKNQQHSTYRSTRIMATIDNFTHALDDDALRWTNL